MGTFMIFAALVALVVFNIISSGGVLIFEITKHNDDSRSLLSAVTWHGLSLIAAVILLGVSTLVL